MNCPPRLAFLYVYPKEHSLASEELATVGLVAPALMNVELGIKPRLALPSIAGRLTYLHTSTEETSGFRTH